MMKINNTRINNPSIKEGSANRPKELTIAVQMWVGEIRWQQLSTRKANGEVSSYTHDRTSLIPNPPWTTPLTSVAVCHLSHYSRTGGSASDCLWNGGQQQELTFAYLPTDSALRQGALALARHTYSTKAHQTPHCDREHWRWLDICTLPKLIKLRIATGSTGVGWAYHVLYEGLPFSSDGTCFSSLARSLGEKFHDSFPACAYFF